MFSVDYEPIINSHSFLIVPLQFVSSALKVYIFGFALYIYTFQVETVLTV